MWGRRTTKGRNDEIRMTNVGVGLLCRLVIHRRRPWRRNCAGFVNVLAPHFRVLVRCGKVDRGFAAQHCLFKQSFKIGTAPAAAGPRTVAIRELRWAFGLFDSNVVKNLPLCHMETEAKFIVGGHQILPFPLGEGWGEGITCRESIALMIPDKDLHPDPLPAEVVQLLSLHFSVGSAFFFEAIEA
jgi:hypothetical protein